MDPQQELHPLTESVIGGSPINYSKKLLLRNCVHGTCDLLENGPVGICERLNSDRSAQNRSIPRGRTATFLQNHYDDRAAAFDESTFKSRARDIASKGA